MERAEKDAEKAEDEKKAETAWAAVVAAAELVLAEIDADRLQVCPQSTSKPLRKVCLLGYVRVTLSMHRPLSRNVC